MVKEKGGEENVSQSELLKAKKEIEVIEQAI